MGGAGGAVPPQLEQARVGRAGGLAVAEPLPYAVRAQAENFPVALSLLPGRFRQELMILYRFARMVDDLGDEAPADRMALLEEVYAELAGGSPTRPEVAEALEMCARLRLGTEPLLRLVEANRIDQKKSRYRNFEELLWYCSYSANPVGEVVLAIFGRRDPYEVSLSDSVCSALQVIEHLQDIAEDARRGRIYLPEEDMEAFGVTEADLFARRASSRLRRLVAYEAQRSANLLQAGVELVGRLSGWARLAVAGYVGGGRASLEAIVAFRYDTLGHLAKPRRPRTARHILALSLGLGNNWRPR